MTAKRITCVLYSPTGASLKLEREDGRVRWCGDVSTGHHTLAALQRRVREGSFWVYPTAHGWQAYRQMYSRLGTREWTILYARDFLYEMEDQLAAELADGRDLCDLAEKCENIAFDANVALHGVIAYLEGLRR